MLNFLSNLLNTVAAAGSACGGGYLPMLAGAMLQGDALSMQMAAMEQQIVQTNMQNPQVQALYQQHKAQGGMLSLADFAYQYAATGGFTPEGMARYRSSEMANQAKEQAAWQGLQAAQSARADAQNQMQEHFSTNQNEFGRTLRGESTWTDPAGASYSLPHTLPANSMHYDPATGRYFRTDVQGNYQIFNNGWWYDMQSFRQ